jgi:hypothetical protein
MTFTGKRSIVLATAALGLAVLAFRFAHAEGDATKGPGAHPMRGTYLVEIDTGSERSESRALIDPSVIRIGETDFLHGTVSDTGGRIVSKTVFSGQTAFIPLDRIVYIQQLKVNW